MVGFVIGLLVGIVIGFMIMTFIKVGGDDLEQYYIDLIQTYDKEVNRQYKVIKNAIEYIRSKNDLEFDQHELLQILREGVEK